MRQLTRHLAIGSGLTLALALGAGCTPLDIDMRGAFGNAPSTAEAARTAAPTAPRPAPDERGIISYPGYQVAVARSGDTLARLAARIGANAEELARFNGIQTGDSLRDGEIVLLPNRVAEPAGGPIRAPGEVDIATVAGGAIARADAQKVETTALAPAPQVGAEPVRHRVERGETAYSIARLYNVSVRSLADWNGLGPDFMVREGQYLLIPVPDPDATPPRRTAAATAAVTPPGAGSPTPTPPSAARPLPAETTAPAAAPAPPVAAPDLGRTETPASSARMVRPVEGAIIRDYAKGRNDGIDIAASPGAPVKAADAGTVAAITEDSNKIPIVVIRHEGGLLTVYSNLAALRVGKGDTVTRGQQIAEIPRNGAAALHFEVRDGFESVDPNRYLRP
ncbi:MAG: peptidoglycan DD-metalloendopeptidase family protein [Roseovarius sp.]|nr:peptidoglycan DD-metalloendopeptidase family protein [Roseovarius sp.]